ncbi:MAG: PLP-dependent transferase [Lachnospiraceae bacterium]|nr:PLP-dependent transferase [Lachnospiraceae bacterium]
MADKEYGFDTLKIQAGYDSADNKYSVSPPIYHTAAFDFRDTEHAENLFTYKEQGFLYTRVGNPTVLLKTMMLQHIIFQFLKRLLPR